MTENDLIVQTIYNFIKSAPVRRGKMEISLLGGNSGIVLFLALLHKHTADETIKTYLLNIYHSSLRKISHGHTHVATFCDGLSGFAWLSCYLRKLDLVEFDPDVFFEDLDLYLYQCLQAFLAEGNWDLLHGALGLGIYFIERGNNEAAERILEYLKHEAEPESGQMKWSRFEPHFSEDIYDFGVAHGNAGIAHYLYQLGSSNESYAAQCKSILNQIFDFYIENAQDLNVVGSYFYQKSPKV
jgi:lantibiotic biosynthesis protein